MSKTVDELVKDLEGKDITLVRDYSSIINWAVGKLKNWAPDWTDYTITDPGILFMNAGAFGYDKINFLLDQRYLNNLIRYTKSRESLYFMSLLNGLTLPGYTSATGTAKFYNNASRPVEIPRNYHFYVRDLATGETIHFSTLEKKSISAGEWERISIIEGERKILTLCKEDFNDSYIYSIPEATIGMNSFILSLDNSSPFVSVKAVVKNDHVSIDAEGAKVGVLREDLSADVNFIPQVEDAFLNTTLSLCFSTHYANDHIEIKLPPGAKEELSDERLVFEYSLSSGVKGNLGNVQAIPLDTIKNDFEQDVTRFCSVEIEDTEGGCDTYNLEETRIFVGDNNWRSETLVRTEDFNYLFREDDRIIRLVSQMEKGAENFDLYYVPASSVEDEKELTSYIEETIQDYLYGGMHASVRPVGERRVSFTIEVGLENNSSDTTVLEKTIKEIVAEELDRDTQPECFFLRRNSIIATIEERLSEAQYAMITSPNADILAEPTEILVLAGVIVKFVKAKK